MNRQPGPAPPAVEICLAGGPAVLEHGLLAARAGGADRVELCRAMGVGGLGPAPWQVRMAADLLRGGPRLVVMVRRRADFTLSALDVEHALRDMAGAARAGAQGVALGALKGRRLDEAAMSRLVRAAHDLGLAVTCHRAFDEVADPRVALDLLADLGVARVLASGLRWGAALEDPRRWSRLARVVELAAARLEVVVCGGLSPACLPRVLAMLPRPSRISFHAYSGVRRGRRVHACLVSEFVAAARQ